MNKAELEKLIDELLGLCHTPNPRNDKDWRVAPGNGARFSSVIERLRQARSTTEVAGDK